MLPLRKGLHEGRPAFRACPQQGIVQRETCLSCSISKGLRTGSPAFRASPRKGIAQKGNLPFKLPLESYGRLRPTLCLIFIGSKPPSFLFIKRLNHVCSAAMCSHGVGDMRVLWCAGQWLPQRGWGCGGACGSKSWGTCCCPSWPTWLALSALALETSPVSHLFSAD